MVFTVVDTSNAIYSDEITFNVTPEGLDVILITPSGPIIYDANGTGQTYSAIGYDLYDNEVAFIPAWSVSSTVIGSIIPATGVFTPSNTVSVGNVICTDIVSGVQATSAVSVVDIVPPVIVGIENIELLNWQLVNLSANQCFDNVSSSLAYVWTIESIGNRTTEDISLSMGTPGIYNAILQVTDVSGNSAQRLFTITIFMDTDEDSIADSEDNDIDGDGLTNTWETDYGMDPYNPNDASSDPDNDGLTNLEEFAEGTDPTNPDTDGDGVSDGDEVAEGKDPLDLHDHDPPYVLYGIVIAILIIVAIISAIYIPKHLKEKAKKTEEEIIYKTEEKDLLTSVPQQPEAPPLEGIVEKAEMARPDDWKPPE